jgi:hypothetical protein
LRRLARAISCAGASRDGDGSGEETHQAHRKEKWRDFHGTCLVFFLLVFSN